MIIKKTISYDGIQVKYEAHLTGTLDKDLQGTVVVHDPDFKGGRRKAFILPEGQKASTDHVVICRIAIKY